MLSRVKCNKIGDVNGYTPLECFVLCDTHGKKDYPCTDYETLDLLMCGKENVNLQIKMWVETTFEMPITLMPVEVKEMTKSYRPWVFSSYVNQLCRLYIKHQGFNPKFLREFIA